MVRGRNDWGQSGMCGERGLNGRREKPYYKGIIFPRYRVKTRKVSGRNARAKFLPSLVVLGSDPDTNCCISCLTRGVLWQTKAGAHSMSILSFFTERNPTFLGGH